VGIYGLMEPVWLYATQLKRVSVKNGLFIGTTAQVLGGYFNA